MVVSTSSIKLVRSPIATWLKEPRRSSYVPRPCLKLAPLNVIARFSDKNKILIVCLDAIHYGAKPKLVFLRVISLPLNDFFFNLLFVAEYSPQLRIKMQIAAFVAKTDLC